MHTENVREIMFLVSPFGRKQEEPSSSNVTFLFRKQIYCYCFSSSFLGGVKVSLIVSMYFVPCTTHSQQNKKRLGAGDGLHWLMGWPQGALLARVPGPFSPGLVLIWKLYKYCYEPYYMWSAVYRQRARYLPIPCLHSIRVEMGVFL